MPISFDDFDKVDIRVGKIIQADDFPQAKKPAYKLTIDFGSEIGVKSSSVQAVGAHDKHELIGMLVLAVVNFAPKQIGSFISEVLTLGLKNSQGQGWVLITPSKASVNLGDKLQ